MFQVTPEAQAQVMPGLLDGSQSMCFGLSEPNAGSDASMIRTRATRDGDGWRISGCVNDIHDACGGRSNNSSWAAATAAATCADGE